MCKKTIKTILISILFIFVIFSGCKNTKSQVQTKGGLKIHNWSSALGSVNETDLDKTKFSYSINLTNQNEKNIYIKSIQPLVNEAIKNKIISNDLIVAINKDIKPNETIEISGELLIDTKGLSKSDIVKLEPFIADIKVSTDETFSLKH
jgi:PBP1b-binding outer membrane lipoprotein LpoB